MRVYRFPNKRLIGQRQRKIAVVLLSEDLSEDIALCEDLNHTVPRLRPLRLVHRLRFSNSRLPREFDFVKMSFVRSLGSCPISPWKLA